MKKQTLLAAALGALSLAAAAPAQAQFSVSPEERAASPDLALPQLAEPPAASASAAEEPALGEPLTDADLGELRGGQTIVLGNQTLNAITSGNSLRGDYTAGDVTLSDNALSAFTGMGNFAINTGAQVSLQSGMNVVINVGD